MLLILMEETAVYRIKLKRFVLVFALVGLLGLGATTAFTCSSGECRVTARAQKYWQAAPEYPSMWKKKIRLFGYISRSGA